MANWYFKKIGLNLISTVEQEVTETKRELWKKIYGLVLKAFEELTWNLKTLAEIIKNWQLRQIAKKVADLGGNSESQVCRKCSILYLC